MQNVSDAASREIAEGLFRAINEQDLEGFHGRFQEDSVVEYPQSGECIVGEGFASPKKISYLYFKEWAEEAGEHYTMTQVEFNEKMLGKFEEGRSKGGRFWKGFKLKRREDEFESRMMEDVANFGMGQVQ